MTEAMTAFFRFPHIPHLAWLGYASPRDDKLMSTGDAQALVNGEIVVEEKLDGANIGISLAATGALQVQNRGGYLVEPYSGQFRCLGTWLAEHREAVSNVLRPDLILFGEWCAARHTVPYDRLPDWFVVFDVYDRSVGRFFSASRRTIFSERCGLAEVPTTVRGRMTLAELGRLVQSARSNFRNGPLEGLIIRRESADWLLARAKLVRPDFVQGIGDHWRRRVIDWNRLAAISAPGVGAD